LSSTSPFVNVLSLKFLWNGETRQESSTSDFVVCMEMSAWVPAVSEGGWNILRTETADIADQPRWCRQRTAASERNKQKIDELIRQDRRITVRGIAAQLGVGHHAVQEMMETLGYRKVCSRWIPRLLTGKEKHKTAGNCSPIHPTVWIWPPQTTTCSDPWNTTWEVTNMRQTRQSWKPCEAGCEGLERTYTAKASLRFCSATRNE
jgi:hypothetical protein